MSEIKARRTGPGVHMFIPVGDEGEIRGVEVDTGQELPTEIDGLAVPTSFRDGLLEQKDGWAQVKRQTAKAEKKEED